MGADLVTRLGDPAHRQAIDRLGPGGVGLAGVDGRPRRAVDHDVRSPRRHRGNDGAAIGDVEITAGQPEDLVTRRFARRNHIVTELPSGAGDKNFHFIAFPGHAGRG